MVLQGRVDDNNLIWFNITVEGNNKAHTFDAILDTGFTGDLLLPLSIAIPLGLTLRAVAPYSLADGSISKQMLFDAKINWGTNHRDIVVNVADTDMALIGGSLLHGYTLAAAFFGKKTAFIVEPGTTLPVTTAEGKP